MQKMMNKTETTTLVSSYIIISKARGKWFGRMDTHMMESGKKVCQMDLALNTILMEILMKDSSKTMLDQEKASTFLPMVKLSKVTLKMGL